MAWRNHLEVINGGRALRGLAPLGTLDERVSEQARRAHLRRYGDTRRANFLWRGVVVTAALALTALAWLLYELFGSATWRWLL